MSLNDRLFSIASSAVEKQRKTRDSRSAVSKGFDVATNKSYVNEDKKAAAKALREWENKTWKPKVEARLKQELRARAPHLKPGSPKYNQTYESLFNKNYQDLQAAKAQVQQKIGTLRKPNQTQRELDNEYRTNESIRNDTVGTQAAAHAARDTVSAVGGALATGSSRLLRAPLQLAADVGENDDGGIFDRGAKALESYEDDISNNVYQAYGDIQQNGNFSQKLAVSAVEQVPSLAASFGAAGAAAKSVQAAGAGAKATAAASYGVAGASMYPQAYLDGSDSTKDELENATSEQLANAERSQDIYKGMFDKNVKAGMSEDEAHAKARDQTISEIAEESGENVGLATLALSMMAPGVGSFTANRAAGGAVSQWGQKVFNKLAARADASKAGKYAIPAAVGVGIAGLNVAEEGAQEGYTDYVAQKAAVDVGVKDKIDTAQNTEAVLMGGILGGLMGGATYAGTRNSKFKQAQDELKSAQQTYAEVAGQIPQLQEQIQTVSPRSEEGQALTARVEEARSTLDAMAAEAEKVGIPRTSLARRAPRIDPTNSFDSDFDGQVEGATELSEQEFENALNPDGTPAAPVQPVVDSQPSEQELDAQDAQIAELIAEQAALDEAIEDGSNDKPVEESLAAAQAWYDNKRGENKQGLSGVVSRAAAKVEDAAFAEQQQAIAGTGATINDYIAAQRAQQAQIDAEIEQAAEAAKTERERKAIEQAKQQREIERAEAEAAITKRAELAQPYEGESFDTTVVGADGTPFNLARFWDSTMPAAAKAKAIADAFGGQVEQNVAKADWQSMPEGVQKELHQWMTGQLDAVRQRRAGGDTQAQPISEPPLAPQSQQSVAPTASGLTMPVRAEQTPAAPVEAEPQAETVTPVAPVETDTATQLTDENPTINIPVPTQSKTVAPKDREGLAEYFAKKLDAQGRIYSQEETENAIREEMNVEFDFNNPVAYDAMESSEAYSQFAKEVLGKRKVDITGRKSKQTGIASTDDKDIYKSKPAAKAAIKKQKLDPNSVTIKQVKGGGFEIVPNAPAKPSYAQAQEQAANELGLSLDENGEYGGTDAEFEAFANRVDEIQGRSLNNSTPTPVAKTKPAPNKDVAIGKDGKAKWFGKQDKAQAFIDKKGISDTHEVVQAGKRFEILPKAQAAPQADVAKPETVPASPVKPPQSSVVKPETAPEKQDDSNRKLVVGDRVVAKNNNEYKITDVEFNSSGGVESVSTLLIPDASSPLAGKKRSPQKRSIAEFNSMFGSGVGDFEVPSATKKSSGKNITDEQFAELTSSRTTPSTPTGVQSAPAKRAAAKKAKKQSDATAEPKSRFADNKLFTEDKVAAARARLKSKLTQVNSGLDPEILMDGITLAGAYIESGVRKFADYAKMMMEDVGPEVKPYLLSFWNSARDYPGLDSEGMTSEADSRAEFNKLMAEPVSPALTSDEKAVQEVFGMPLSNVSNIVFKKSERLEIKAKRTRNQDDQAAANKAKREARQNIMDVEQAVIDYAKRKMTLGRFLDSKAGRYQDLIDAAYEDRDKQAGFTGNKASDTKPASEPAKTEQSKYPQTVGSGPQMKTFIGENQAGLPLYENESGVRAIEEYGIFNNETVSITPTGIEQQPRENRYLTKEELAAKTKHPESIDVGDDKRLFVGENMDGEPIYEDKNGIRSKPEGNFMASEPVGINLGSEGPAYDVSRRADKFKTVEELNEDSNDDTGTSNQDDRARAELDRIREFDQADEKRWNAGSAQAKSTSDVDAVDGRSDRSDTNPSDADSKSAAASQRAGANDSSSRADSVESDDRTAQASDATPTVKPKNHVIDADQTSGKLSWQKVAERNVDIIELLKQLDSEGRQATSDEQALLAQYAGWGSSEIANGIFPNPDTGKYKSDSWRALGEKLKSLLTDSEYDTARRTTQYAHYTPPVLVNGIYKALEGFGFKGGQVLEPASGIGVFNGLMPSKLANSSTYVGLELDPITGRIAQQLYPESSMRIDDYIKAKLPDNHFDVAVGNPPFAGISVDYKGAGKNSTKQSMQLHDYFFAKTLDKLKPGGVMAFVTSKGTMDKKGSSVREYLAEQADLIGAIRLPQTAFKENAGTEVVTDIIFLRKRHEGEQPSDTAWASVKSIKASGKPTAINEYFVNNPDMVLGEHAIVSGRFGDTYTVTPNKGDFAKQVDNAIAKLPKDVFNPQRGSQAEAVKVMDLDYDPASAANKEGGVYLKDGKLMRVVDGVGKPLTQRYGTNGKAINLSAKDIAFMTDYVGVRDALKQAQRDQLTDSDTWEDSLANLNEVYDAFVKKHGRLMAHSVSERENADGTTTVTKRFKNKQRLFLDVEGVLASALENVIDDGKGTVVKGSFFEGRSLRKPKAPTIKSTQDALVYTLDEKGVLDIARIAALTGKTEPQIIEELGEQIYNDPQSKQWDLAETYLSGNVVDKLKKAEIAAKTNKSYSRNVAALKAVQPAPIAPNDIASNMGAAWIPGSVINEFSQQVLGANVTAKYSPVVGLWDVGGTSKSSDYSTADRSAVQLVESILNSRKISISRKSPDGSTYIDSVATELANEVARKIKTEFKNWLWSDDTRAQELADYYNKTYNNIVPPTFNGDHLTLAGMSNKIQLRAPQKRGIYRVIRQGDVYLNHAVGAGKTFTMIAAAMEEKRLGLINKPMFVVPNHMLDQFSQEFLMLYPAANIMVADEQNFHTHNRKQFVAQAALNTPDAIIITHSSFERIGVKPDTKKAFLEDKIAEWRAALELTKASDGDNRISVKQLERNIESLERSLEDILNAKEKDGAVFFEDMGVDKLYIDEAHEFRKLNFVTKMGNIKGIDPAGSQKAMDLDLKLQLLRENNPSRAFVGASGTPVTNTMGELYTIQRYFQPDQLEQDGLHHFDSWANQFGEVVEGLEQNAAGNYEVVPRFARFVNVPELMSRVRSFMDVLTSNDLSDYVTRPEVKTGGREVVAIPTPDGFKEYQASLAARIEAIRKRSGKPEKGDDIILSVIGDGRFSAIDMRFVDPTLPSDPNSKLNTVIRDMAEAYHATADNEYMTDGAVDDINGGALMMFTDIGLGEQSAASRGFDMKQWITDELVRLGVDPDHIAFMRDNKTHAKKGKLFDDMRQGRKRIMIGGKDMETGVNAQKRLTHLFHLDAPWFPASVEQREGRIIRQGNQNKEVVIRAYATKGSYDSTMWSMVARKARFIEQAMRGDMTVRSMDDVSEASAFEQASALSSGDPRSLQLAGLRQDVERLNRQLSGFQNEKFKNQSQAKQARQTLARAERELDAINKLLPTHKTVETGDVIGKVGSKSFDNRTEFGQAIIAEYNKYAKDYHIGEQVLGTVAGYDVVYNGVMMGGGNFYADANINIPKADDAALFDTDNVKDTRPDGLTTRIINRVNKLADYKAKVEAVIEQAQTDAANFERRAGKSFDAQTELDEKTAELIALEEELATEAELLKAASEGNGLTEEDRVPGTEEPKFSKANPAKGLTGTTAKQVISLLQDRFGKEAVAQLIKAGKLRVRTLNDFVDNNGRLLIPSDAEGFYYDGKVTLIADNLTPETVVATLLHELGGHAGIQSMLSTQTYMGLMENFYGLVKSGNKYAVRAKQRAEASTHSASEARDEYIPYLITEYAQATERGGPLAVIKRFVNRVMAGVRAWVRNHTGVQLKMTPNDMVQLAERMVKRLAEQSMDSVTIAGMDNTAAMPQYSQESTNQTATPAFKKWFGDSKVVDGNGKPLVVYHGTNANFNTFSASDVGIHVGTEDQANSRAEQKEGGDFKLMPLYVKAENPLRLKDARSWKDPEWYLLESGISSYLPASLQQKISDFAQENRAAKDLNTPEGQKKAYKKAMAINSEVARFLKDELGYDSIVYANTHDGTTQDNKVKADDSWIVFDPEQIKSATNNIGTFDANNPDIRFSRRYSNLGIDTSPTTAKEKAIDAAKQSAATALSSKFNLSLLLRRHLATPLHVGMLNPSFKKFFENVQARIAYENNEAGRIQEYMPEIWDTRLMVGKRKEAIDKVSRALFDGTMADEVWTDSELETRFNLDENQKDMYRRARAAIDSSVSHMTVDTLSSLAKGTKLINIHTINRLKLAELAPIDHKLALQQHMVDELARLAQSGSITPAAERRLQNQLDEVFDVMDGIAVKYDDLVEKGYAPLMRFGHYAVEVRDKSTGELDLFELYETKGQQRKAIKELKEKYDENDFEVGTGTLNPDAFKQFTNKGLSPETVQLFAAELGLDNDGAYQAYLKVAVSNQSALKRLIHRKKVPGYSEDLPRVLSSFVMSNARYSGRALYNGEIENAIQKIEDGNLQGEAQNVFANMENPQEEFAGVRGLLFHYYMGFSTAFMALNLTQPLTQTIPKLTAYVGAARAHRDMTQALGIVAKYAGKATFELGKKVTGNATPNWKGFEDHLPAWVRQEDYLRMTREGHLDPQNIWMIRGLERGKAGVISGLWGNLSRAAGWAAEVSETINRRGTMIAAFKAAQTMGDTELRAKGFNSRYDFAVSIIQQTQGVYNKGNRSGLARGTGKLGQFGPLVMVFKQFSINYAEQMIRHGRDKEVKSIAVAMTWQFLLAGALGLPFTDDLRDIVEGLLYRLFGRATNLTAFLQDELGKENADALMYGLLSEKTRFDMYGRSSMGNFIPGTDFARPKEGDWAEVIGASSGFFENFFTAGDMITKGQYKDAAVIAAPRYVRDAAAGIEIWNNGAYRNQKGDKVMDMDRTDAVIKGALQFNPASNAQQGRERSEKYHMKNMVLDKQNQFALQLTEALYQEDYDRVDELYNDMDAWNERNPEHFNVDIDKIEESAERRLDKKDFTSDDRQRLPEQLDDYFTERE
ncbi:PLxRFG domain-containing protein [Psychrobacter sp. Marseille-P5312]|uniref:PLxRFG domain-containing protein n=1 Tax=Psychrobacter sp. Marseille-P5312 TaxID=2086574 RepID=UPI000CF620D3|nr:PLxRFG domain-containing protein [Psychrobacter sp. Marseille-P5312]